MPVEYFVRYQGKCYDVGTKLRFKPTSGSYIKEGTIVHIDCNHIYIRLIDGSRWRLSKICGLEKTIVEILEPVYYEEPPKKNVRRGVCPSENDIFLGWILYILTMLVGTRFSARILIWIVATVVFFSWKNGLLKGKNQ